MERQAYRVFRSASFCFFTQALEAAERYQERQGLRWTASLATAETTPVYFHRIGFSLSNLQKKLESFLGIRRLMRSGRRNSTNLPKFGTLCLRASERETLFAATG